MWLKADDTAFMSKVSGVAMVELMPDRLPWFVAGPALGLLVVGLYALLNRPLGSLGGYMQTLTLIRGQRPTEMWRVWFFGGVIGGGALAAVLRGDWALGFGYGVLGVELSMPLLILTLLAGGLLMGYGARWAGGCTTGHGLCGVAVGSPGSIAATATFILTAIGVTALLTALIGGAL